MTTIDLTKTYRDHYTATDSPTIVSVPDRPYLMVDGEGDPNTSQAYQDALAALYPLAYGLRKAVKDATGEAYKVMPLEGLWWVDDMTRFSLDDKDSWHWTAMICLPNQVTAEIVAEIIPTVTAKKKLAVGHLARVEPYGDGTAAQVLHRGPYADEAPTIERLHRFIDESGYRFRGKHHEIYLTDPRKSAPANNRTIIRQPFAR